MLSLTGQKLTQGWQGSRSENIIRVGDGSLHFLVEEQLPMEVLVVTWVYAGVLHFTRHDERLSHVGTRWYRHWHVVPMPQSDHARRRRVVRLRQHAPLFCNNKATCYNLVPNKLMQVHNEIFIRLNYIVFSIFWQISTFI